MVQGRGLSDRNEGGKADLNPFCGEALEVCLQYDVYELRPILSIMSFCMNNNYSFNSLRKKRMHSENKTSIERCGFTYTGTVHSGVIYFWMLRLYK